MDFNELCMLLEQCPYGTFTREGDKLTWMASPVDHDTALSMRQFILSILKAINIECGFTVSSTEFKTHRGYRGGDLGMASFVISEV